MCEALTKSGSIPSVPGESHAVTRGDRANVRRACGAAWPRSPFSARLPCATRSTATATCSTETRVRRIRVWRDCGSHCRQKQAPPMRTKAIACTGICGACDVCGRARLSVAPSHSFGAPSHTTHPPGHQHACLWATDIRNGTDSDQVCSCGRRIVFVGARGNSRPRDDVLRRSLGVPPLLLPMDDWSHAE